MKVKVVQIVWHNKEPVFSLDFHPSGVLATCGADCEIKLWRFASDSDNFTIDFLSSITGDKYDTGYKNWNCVRFCPTGQSLAAAGDVGQIFIFKPSETSNQPLEDLTNVSWRASSCGAYSPDDVVDISWAADASGFLTASNDNTCMFWDPEAKQGRAKLRLEGHRLYVQGVAWDPLHQFVVSQGADRSCRGSLGDISSERQLADEKKPHCLVQITVYRGKALMAAAQWTRIRHYRSVWQTSLIPPAWQFRGSRMVEHLVVLCRVFSMLSAVPGLKKKAAAAVNKPAINHLEGLHCSNILSKSVPPPTAGDSVDGKPPKKAAGQHLFLDESLNSFFRRLSWSPDGSMLVVPAGVSKAPESAGFMHVAYIYARGVWNAPLIQIPAASKPVVAVRFCPVLFELEALEPAAAEMPIDLPYRMIFALATKDSVMLYDTQAAFPLAILGGLHLEQITDLAWSLDGNTLAISSYDSYCSVACFEEGELGRRMAPEAIPAHIRGVLWGTIAEEYKQAAISDPARPARAAKGNKDSLGGERGGFQGSGKQRPDPAAMAGGEGPRAEKASSAVAESWQHVLGAAGQAARKRITPTATGSGMVREPLEAPKGQNGSSQAGAGGFKRVRRIAPVPVGPAAGGAALVWEHRTEPAERRTAKDPESSAGDANVAEAAKATETGGRAEAGQLSIAELCAAAGRAAAASAKQATSAL